MFALALLLAVPFVARVAYAQPESNCTRNYTVMQGDICDSISGSQSVSTFQLAVVNEDIIDDECDNLQPGSTICLGWSGMDCTATYVVQLGDTCDCIADAYNINDTMLYQNNPQIDEDCTNIYVNEVLCVADSVIVPPTPTSPIYGSQIPPTATAATDLFCDD